MQVYFLMSIFGLISTIIALANYPVISGFFYFGIGPGIFLLLTFNKYVIRSEY
jgi:hypothetical protein